MEYLELNTTVHGSVTFAPDGQEGLAFWIQFDGLDNEPWYEFTFEEALKIRTWLNDYLEN